MNRKIELLAPGGDIESIKAAIAAGADAIYCGLDKFNARNRATNIDVDDLNGILNLAHRNDCQIFLTLNIIILEHEISAVIKLLNRLVNTSLDGVIVQDLGLFYLISKYFKSLKLHASTQLTTHNAGQIKFLSRLNNTRVNLSRELNLAEIRDLTAVAHANKTETEVFVHGSNCIGFSGICYISSVLGGKSGNRGRCSQPCRDRYLTTPACKNFPLNLKDNSAYAELQAIYEAGVDSIKIEGRIKKFHYVYTVVDAWQQQLDKLYEHRKLNDSDAVLYEVFNRDYTNSFLKGDINKQMYIDNPRDNSAIRLAETAGDTSEEGLSKAKGILHDKGTEVIAGVNDKIGRLSIEKSPLCISFSGATGDLLRVSVQTLDASFELFSESRLAHIGNRSPSKNQKSPSSGLDHESLAKKFNSLNDTEYRLEQLCLENLQTELFIPFKEITSLKKQILFRLNGSREQIEPIKPALPKTQTQATIKPSLGVLISAQEDLGLCGKSTADIFFQLPSCFEHDYAGFIDLFWENSELIPWFPSVLIGNDYLAALDILKQTRPKLIVTNNTGIAYEADKEEIPWIAGPCLNIVNSFSLLCLKQHFNCCGAFVSNEISQQQMKNIVIPEKFKLYYSIYHPIQLMTSRQCLLHQVTGCEKTAIDADCLHNCTKSSSITNQENASLFIEKTRGDYHSIYNEHNFLNTDILTDLPDRFSSLLIDLRDIKTATEIAMDKPGIIRMFESLLREDPASKEKLRQIIQPTTDAQYTKGL